MVAPEHPNDEVIVAPGVLLHIAKKSDKGVEGVAGMGNTPGGVNRFLRHNSTTDGVRIAVHDNSITVNLYLVIEADKNIPTVSRNVQRAVTRAMQELVSMEVEAVNIHVENVARDAGEESKR